MSRTHLSLALGLLWAPLALAQTGVDPTTNAPVVPGVLPTIDEINAILTERSGQTYDQNHAKLITSAEVVGALGDNLFGEQVNFYTGATEFQATDLAVPGNSGLSVAASRRLSVEGDNAGRVSYSLGDWQLDLPYIGGIFTARDGWVVGDAGSPLRCSGPTTALNAKPPTLIVGENFTGFQVHEYWHGYILYVPGTGGQSVLFRDNPSTPAPPPDALTGAYKWVTKDFWHLGCAPLLNGQSGDGFVALAPDGTKYHFGKMVASPEKSIGKIFSYGVPNQPNLRGWASIERNEVRLYATLVEDRFGNKVNYNWSGSKLMSISSGDGRNLSFAYYPGTDRIETISDGLRTVRYFYTNAGSLSRVVYADGSQWLIDLENIYAKHYFNCATLDPNVVGVWRCWDQNSPDCAYKRLLSIDGPASGTLRHPSGATGTFSFEYKRHVRAGVPDAHCFIGGYHPGVPGYPNPFKGEGEPWDDFSWTPLNFDVLAIVAKQITGPGVRADQIWRYAYQSGPRLINEYGARTRKAVVDEPGGIRREFTFGNQYDIDEGQLAKVETFSAGALVHSTVNTYVRNDQMTLPPNPNFPFPDRVSTNPLWTADNFSSERLRPLRSESTLQDSVTFTRDTQSFDVFASPLKVSRSSALGSRIDETQYAHNLSKWVIGLPLVETSIDTVTGARTEVSRTDYNAAALPIAQYHFGLPVNTLTYHADGNLLSATDGRLNTTSLTGYYRGVPQRIQFANGLAITAVVNTIGRLESTTDVFGTGTGYRYDTIGRLNRVSYAADGTLEWLPRLLNFAPALPNAPYQLPDGHWQQTIATGAGQTTTHFDALWRPILIVTEAPGATKSIVVKRYDVRGREAFTSYPVASLTGIGDALPGTYTEYDALDRVIRTTLDAELPLRQSVTETQYLLGLKTRVINPRGFTTTTSYQAFDAPSYDAPVLIQAPEGVTTTISRDVFGKPLSVTRSGPGG